MQHWAKTKERGSYRGIVFVLRAYKYGGHWLVRFLLFPIIGYFFLTGHLARQSSIAYLKQLHSYSGLKSPFKKEPSWRDSFYHFWQFGIATLEKTDAWTGKVGHRKVENCGDTHFSDLEQKPEGGVLIGSHLGNIEVARAVASTKYTKRMNVLVFTQHAASFNRALQELNANAAIDLIQVTEVDMALTIFLKERVEQGEFVIIVGDRVSVERPEQCVSQKFLGESAQFAIGPWVLASVLECPIYFLFCLRNSKQDNYHLYLDFAAERLVLPRRNRKQAVREILHDYTSKLERLCMHYPYQWFNFFNFWQHHKDS